MQVAEVSRVTGRVKSCAEVSPCEVSMKEDNASLEAWHKWSVHHWSFHLNLPVNRYEDSIYYSVNLAKITSSNTFFNPSA